MKFAAKEDRSRKIMVRTADVRDARREAEERRRIAPEDSEDFRELVALDHRITGGRPQWQRS